MGFTHSLTIKTYIMITSKELRAQGQSIGTEVKKFATTIARDLLAGVHFTSQTIADGCIKAETKLMKGDYEEIANNRHNTTKQTQQEILEGYQVLVKSLGFKKPQEENK